VMEDKLKHDQWKEVTDKLLDWEEWPTDLRYHLIIVG
jgi:hypothetical protein